MHFRYGDYLQLSAFYVAIDFEYYKNSIEEMLKRDSSITQIICCFEEVDHDRVSLLISNLKEVYPFLSFTSIPSHVDDWEQMLIMSCCKHNIIANSTFSWWSAYFNEHSEKIVCAPERWHAERLLHININVLVPDSWIKIKN